MNMRNGACLTLCGRSLRVRRVGGLVMRIWERARLAAPSGDSKSASVAELWARAIGPKYGGINFTGVAA